MDKKKVLFVEGIDDRKVVERLLNRRKIEPSFEINDCDGLSKLKKLVEIAIKAGNHDIIGLIVDADQDLHLRWKEFKKLLEGQHYVNVPPTPTEKGIIVFPPEDEVLPKVGIWIMPDNFKEGTLEDFVKQLIPIGDELLPIAESTINQLITDEKNRFSVDKKGKAIIHTWLAWQERPGTLLGKSLVYQSKKKYLLDDKKANTFVNWLKKLFKEQ